MPISYVHVFESGSSRSSFRLLCVSYGRTWQIGHVEVRREGEKGIRYLCVKHGDETSYLLNLISLDVAGHEESTRDDER
jgi:hypothetical protein